MGRCMDAKALRTRALALLALREHSPQELQRKLLQAWQRASQKSGQEVPEDAEQVVSELAEQLSAQGLLSAERYVEGRLRTRAPRLGARRLQAELAQQGLKPEGEVWESVQASESERARALLVRRFGEGAPPDAKERARRVRFLVSRGFDGGLAMSLTRSSALDALE
ncbi:regulatory protein RecX [Inhella inkyongensis]|uniref:regulatory protein RecX n=1 Tax=Inhella inkyongensis TaxID=392593 RepID=UPI001FEC4840|nr:regulatory protein RecX [Inhella inkyongensis]